MKLEKTLGLAALSSLVLFYSFTPDGKDKKTNKAIDLANMDKSVRPQDDFYEFANGGWLKNNPVPSTESKWGSFSALLEENQTRLKGILEENTQKANAPGSNGQKIGDYYFTYMDSAKKNKEGVKPLTRFLQQVEEIKSNDQLMAYFATTQMMFSPPARNRPRHSAESWHPCVGPDVENFDSCAHPLHPSP